MLKTESTEHLFKWSALLAGLAVALGAFGAHVLSGQLSDKGMDVFNKAGFYLLTHNLAVIMLLSVNKHTNIRVSALALYSIFTGALVFSLSLYTITVAELSGFNVLRKAGIIAPAGGIGMIGGWLILAWQNFRKHPK